MAKHTFSNGSEAVAVYGQPRIARRLTEVRIREVNGESEVFPNPKGDLTAVRGIDLVVVPCDGSKEYPHKKDLFVNAWEEKELGTGIYRRKALNRVIPIPEGDEVVLKTKEGDRSASYPDFIAIGTDGEVYSNEASWVEKNLRFLTDEEVAAIG